jgi:4a-hydroxytetrahydrobiopterin dehydratase
VTDAGRQPDPDAAVRIPAWRRQGEVLVREMEMRDFDEAWGVVRLIAERVEDYGRRPDMCVSEFNRVRLTIANLHHAGITPAEERLAAKVDAAIVEWARSGGTRPGS